jgi:hypothetical protein
MLLETGQVALYCLFDVQERFVSCFSLAHATGQRWAFDNDEAILVFFKRDDELHCLLPLDRAGGLRGDVVDDAVYARDLVRNPVRDARQDLVR